MLILTPADLHAKIAGPGWIMKTREPVFTNNRAVFTSNLTLPASSSFNGDSFSAISFDRTSGLATLKIGRPESRSESQALSSSTITSGSIGITALASSTITASEITEIARALQYDPVLIYEFVHNNIDYVPYFGALKGPTATLLDRTGNDFDQASLMIELLRESGYTVQYKFVVAAIPNTELLTWLGGVDADYSLVSKTLSSGGILHSLSGGYTIMYRVVVEATINSNVYVFDPAYKTYQETPKIDLEAAMNYNRSDLLTSAGGTAGADYIQNLDNSSLNAKLVEYASNLSAYFNTNNPNAEMEEIIGGREITPEYLDPNSLPTTLPYPIDTDPNSMQYWTDIPAGYFHTLRIEHSGIDETLNIADIAGKRLAIVYDTSTSPSSAQLWLDDIKLVQEPVPGSGSSPVPLTLTVDHFYFIYDPDLGVWTYDNTYQDQEIPASLTRGSTYVILNGFGGEKSGKLVEKRQRVLSEYRTAGLADTSREVLTEALNVMGQTYLQQVTINNNLLNEMGEVIHIPHHSFGIMAQESSYYIDVSSGNSIITRRTAIDKAIPVYKTATFIMSAMEHGVLEQLQVDRPALSTIKLLNLANSAGNKIFQADSSNYSLVQPQLTGYSSGDLTNFQTLVNNGYSLVLPENGSITLNQWSGDGYIEYYDDPNSSAISFGMIIGGGYNGGYMSFMANLDALQVIEESFLELMQSQEILSCVCEDPVDMASGAFLYDQTDLALGGAEPKGLKFSRSYSSANNNAKSTMGYGWTHNYDISLNFHSDIEAGLGRRQPMDAIAVLVSSIATLDIMQAAPTPLAKEWTITALIAQWVMDELTDNAVSVRLNSGFDLYQTSGRHLQPAAGQDHAAY